MKLGTIHISNDIATGFLIIAAILILAVTNNIAGELALTAILGVAGALGVYRRRLRQPGGDGS